MKVSVLTIASLFPFVMALPYSHNITSEMTSMLVAGGSAGALNAAVVAPFIQKIPNDIAKGAVGAGVTSVLFLSMLEFVNWLGEKIESRRNGHDGQINPTIISSAPSAGLPGCCPGCGVNAIAACTTSRKNIENETDPAQDVSESEEIPLAVKRNAFLRDSDLAQEVGKGMQKGNALPKKSDLFGPNSFLNLGCRDPCCFKVCDEKIASPIKNSEKVAEIESASSIHML